MKVIIVLNATQNLIEGHVKISPKKLLWEFCVHVNSAQNVIGKPTLYRIRTRLGDDSRRQERYIIILRTFLVFIESKSYSTHSRREGVSFLTLWHITGTVDV